VKIGIPAVLLTAALATAVTACSSSPESAAGPQSHVSPGAAAGQRSQASGGSTANTAVLSSNPVCRRFQRDLSAWTAAVAEPGNASTVLLNSATRPAWLKFGHQLGQLSHADIRGKDASVAARTAKKMARTASLLKTQGTEPISHTTSGQYQQTVTDLQDVTADCINLSS
jgi:hypothetical protein